MDANRIVMKKSTSSMEEAIANDHILTEILRRLPVKSFLRFKQVSKHWFSLIADDPQLAVRQNPDPNLVSGLFLYPTLFAYCFWNEFAVPNDRGLDFLPLLNDKSPADDAIEVGDHRTLIPNVSGLRIRSSCNGLLCCSGYNEIDQKSHCHVVNPTTKQFTTLPNPHLYYNFDSLNLAFDPSRSPFYKVVNVWSINVVPYEVPDAFNTIYQIEVYSSDTGHWRDSGKSLTVNVHNVGFRDGVFWNGALHWFLQRGDGFYFDVEHEQLGRMPTLPVREGMAWYNRSLMYPLASRGHFHVIAIYGSTGSQLDVYEMEEDYSGWFVKYHVELDPVMAALTGIRCSYEDMAYSVLSLVREEKDEESFLVLHIPGKIIRLNLVDESFKVIHDSGVNGSCLRYYRACHYIESYSDV